MKNAQQPESVTVSTVTELGHALADKALEIRVTDTSLAVHVSTIKNVKRSAWMSAFVGIGAAVTSAAIIGIGSLIPFLTLPAILPVMAGSASVPALILGSSTFIAAVRIGRAAKSPNVLNELRDDYEQVSESADEDVYRRREPPG